MATVAYNGSTWTNTYDADGMRTARKGGNTAYSYVYNGGSLSQMTVSGNTLYFAYDASGTPLSVTYNGTAYYYANNLQGDITAILNTSGTAVVTYTYDAWGNILTTSGSMASTLGAHNPLRYRGYVYDTETGLYYLQSRYYDPEMGRFINADALVSTGQGLLGNNMFAYCRNNPVCRKDITGTTDVATPDDGTELLDEEKTFNGGTTSNGGFGGGGVGSGQPITLYRAVSPAEASSATSTQKFSSGGNSYLDSKFFATSQADAQKGGDFMYKDGNYIIISASFNSGVTTGAGVIFYPWHDGIGPAYLIPISALNASVVNICCV